MGKATNEVSRIREARDHPDRRAVAPACHAAGEGHECLLIGGVGAHRAAAPDLAEHGALADGGAAQLTGALVLLARLDGQPADDLAPFERAQAASLHVIAGHQRPLPRPAMHGDEARRAGAAGGVEELDRIAARHRLLGPLARFEPRAIRVLLRGDALLLAPAQGTRHLAEQAAPLGWLERGEDGPGEALQLAQIMGAQLRHQGAGAGGSGSPTSSSPS